LRTRRIELKCFLAWKGWPLLVITAAAFSLRLFHMGQQGAWDNEAFSITTSALPMDKLTSALIDDFVNPPLHYYLLHAWFALCGSGTYQARLLSVLFGTLSIPTIYLLARHLYGRSVALLASALMGISELGVTYSQEARSYAMFLFLALCTAYLFLKSLEGDGRPARLGFLISAVALLYTHYYGIFVLLALTSYALLFRRSLVPGAVRRILMTLALALGLLIPWLASGVIGKALSSPKTAPGTQPPWFEVKASTLLKTLNHFNNGDMRGPIDSAPHWTFVLGALLFTAPAGMALWRARRAATCQQTSFVLLLCLPLPIIVALSGAFALQYGIRYVSFCTGFYYILVARGVLQLRRAFSAALIVLILAYSAPALQALYSTPYKENYRDALRDLSAQWRAGDCAVFWPFEKIPLQWWIDSRGKQPPLNAIKLQAAASKESGCRRVWLVTYRRLESPTTEAAAEALNKHFRRSARQSYFWITLDLYTTE